MTRPTRGEVAALVVALLLGWFLYRPEVARPFDLLDFGEFLPILRRTEGWWDQVVAVARYNAEQGGRANLTPVVGAVWKWQLFGMWTPGWQLTHAALMVLVMVQSWDLLRRAGLAPVGSVAGASVYLVAPAAVRGWVRLTMGEPLAMVVLLAATALAFDFQRRERWGRVVGWISAAAVFALCTKEMLAPVIALPVVVALTWEPGVGFRWPAWSRRDVVLVSVVATVSAVTLLPMVWLYLGASSSALASQYGGQAVSAGSLFAVWVTTLVPFALGEGAGTAAWGLAMIAWLLLVVVGGVVRARQRDRGRGSGGVFAFALLFPLVGAIAYAPWPTYEERYGFPYLVGSSLLVALGVAALTRAGGVLRTVGGGAWLMCLVFGGGSAYTVARWADARQRATDAVVGLVAASGADSVYVAASRLLEPAWVGLGPTLARFGTATDRPWAPTRDLLCDEARARAVAGGRVAVVAFASQCVGEWPGAQSVRATYRRADWRRWRVVADSVHAMVWTGTNARPGAS